MKTPKPLGGGSRGAGSTAARGAGREGEGGQRARLLALVALAVSCLFLPLRLVRLEADFPWRLTDSLAPYTDEGWYSSAAIRYLLTGHWYLPGDINEVIVQPTFHLVQLVNFRLFGLGLDTARLPGALMFCGLTVLVALILRTHVSLLAGLLAALLLATNFHLFAYSRIALVELPMLFFVVAAIAILSLGKRESGPIAGVAAGLVFAIACLTKPSALFALPAMGVLLWLRPRPRYRPRVLGFLVALLLPLLAIYGLGGYLYREDLFAYQSTFNGWIVGSPWEAAATVLRALTELLQKEPLLTISLGLALAVTVVRGWLSPSRDRALLFLVGSFLVYLATMGVVIPHPTRYFLPLIMLAAVILATVTARSLESASGPIARLLVVLLAASAGIGAFRSAEYLATARTSYLEVCRDLARQAELTSPDPLLMGDLAPQISIATGFRSLSGKAAAGGLGRLLEEHGPTHYVSLGPIGNEARELERHGYRVVSVSIHRPDDDYRRLEIHLYRLEAASSGR